jgi:glycosyltransferase involved in cell wall biosynthesis
VTLATPRPDVVFTSSPPLPGALTVAAAARLRHIPYVLDVRDLWPAAAEALGELSNQRLITAFEHAERWLYRHAVTVTATTNPFCAHIDARSVPGRAVHLPNGALDELLDVQPAEGRPPQPFTIGYAGNFGIAQGLGIVLDAAEALRDRPVRFRLIGDGPIKAEFVAERDRRDLAGIVETRASIPTAEIGAMLVDCDALLVPLRDHPLLRDFIPSKLYDAMALGRPALVAAAGEPHDLVESAGAGLAVAPEDGPGLAAAIERLRTDPDGARAMGDAGRLAARDLVRSRQVERLETVLIAAAGSR